MGSRVQKPSFNQRPVQADEVCTKEVCREVFLLHMVESPAGWLDYRRPGPDTGTACGLGHGSWC